LALITTTEAKEVLLDVQGATTDDLISSLITTVGRLIANYLGYPPATAGAQATAESSSYTLYLDGPGGRELYIPVYPVTAIASIYDSVDRRYAASDLVSSSDYTLIEGQHGLVELDWDAQHGAWSTARRAIKVTCTAGWSTIPDPIKQAAKLAVKHHLQLRNKLGKTTETQAGGNTSYVEPTELPKEAKLMLNRYRLPTVMVPV
jgi:hypothetical protein